MTTKKKGMSARVSHVQDVEEVTPRKPNGTKVDLGKKDKSIPSPTTSRAETSSAEPVENNGQNSVAAEVQKTPEPRQAAPRTDPLNEPAFPRSFNAATTTTPPVPSGRKLTPSSALQEMFDTTESTTPSRAPGHRTRSHTPRSIVRSPTRCPGNPGKAAKKQRLERKWGGFGQQQDAIQCRGGNNPRIDRDSKHPNA